MSGERITRAITFSYPPMRLLIIPRALVDLLLKLHHPTADKKEIKPELSVLMLNWITLLASAFGNCYSATLTQNVTMSVGDFYPYRYRMVGTTEGSLHVYHSLNNMALIELQPIWSRSLSGAIHYQQAQIDVLDPVPGTKNKLVWL